MIEKKPIYFLNTFGHCGIDWLHSLLDSHNQILIMPALHSAAISTKLMKVFGGGKLIGPLLIGLGSPIEVAPLRASTSEILNLASIAAYSSDVIDYSS